MQMFDFIRSKVNRQRNSTDGISAQGQANGGGRRMSQQEVGSAQAQQQIQTSATMQRRKSEPKSAGKAAKPADPNVLISTTLDSDDVNKYDVTQVYTFVLDKERQYEAYYETSQDNIGSDEYWELDDRLIDYDMLSAQPEDADKIYEELKKRALAQKRREKAHDEIDSALEIDEIEQEDDTSESSVEMLGSTKILELIRGYSKMEREDFTNNLLGFANKKDKRQIDILLPALKELASDEFADVKKALLNQFTPLVALITENFGEMGYQSICGAVFPLLDALMYDEKEDVRDRAIQVVADIRTVVKEDWKEHVVRLALNLAHDEDAKLRESAIKLLNEVSADMGQEVNEVFIVTEFKALGMDEHTSVKCTLAQNLTNVSKNISTDVFSSKLFPLYDQLTQDKEWKVRKACADVVSQVAEVTPMDRDADSIQRLYYRFLLDPSSKIVRGTAFQNIGPFIATLKDSSSIDQRITDFFINTTMKTNNKDVCYYASFNFPAFIWVTGKEHWHKFRGLYVKLTGVSDIQTQRTLSCSLHEIARILGSEITDSDLLSIADKFLRHNSPDVRLGIMKNLHVLLAEVPEAKRSNYIQHIMQTFNEAGNDWRTKEMLARNLGKFAVLFDQRIVYSEFLPMFFKFCEDPIAMVCHASATALSPILNKFQGDRDQQKAIIKIVKNNFRQGNKATYKRRQLFIIMCEEIMNQSKDLFEEYFKIDMLSLAADRVVNVRLALARALKNHFRTINCTFMHDPLVNQAVKVLLQDKSQDVVDLVQDIVQFQADLDSSSQSSRNSNQSGDHETAMSSFMESLNRSIRSSQSSVLSSEISEMENEIILKAGIDITKNNSDSVQSKAPEVKRPISSGANFVSGVEEDLNVASDRLDVAYDDAAAAADYEAGAEDIDALLQEEDQFGDTLEVREDFEEQEEDEEEKLAPLSSLLGEPSTKDVHDADTMTKGEPEKTDSPKKMHEKEEEEKLAPPSSVQDEPNPKDEPIGDKITKVEPEKTDSPTKIHEESISVAESAEENGNVELEAIKDETNHLQEELKAEQNNAGQF